MPPRETGQSVIAIGLDSAPNNTGWCVLSDDERTKPVWGLFEFGGYGHNDQLLMQDVRRAVAGLLQEHKPDAVFFEQIVIDARHVDINVLYAQFSVVSAIQFACLDLEINARQVLIASWRKRLLGRSNMPKHEGKRGKGRDWLKEAAMIEAARLGVLAGTDHEAEAFGIADYGLATISTKYRLATKARADRTAVARRRKDMEK